MTGILRRGITRDNPTYKFKALRFLGGRSAFTALFLERLNLHEEVWEELVFAIAAPKGKKDLKIKFASKKMPKHQFRGFEMLTFFECVSQDNSIGRGIGQ